MNLNSEVVSDQMRDGTRWISVTPENWVAIHQELSSAFPRLEWLTAIHKSGQDFVVTTMVSTLDLGQSLIVSVDATSELASLTEVYPLADFHERETVQMFGLVIGSPDRAKAFDVDFGGNPLRRDFALTPRQDTAWPGAVEPDANARRRPALPPGVFAEWQL